MQAQNRNEQLKSKPSNFMETENIEHNFPKFPSLLQVPVTTTPIPPELQPTPTPTTTSHQRPAAKKEIPIDEEIQEDPLPTEPKAPIDDISKVSDNSSKLKEGLKYFREKYKDKFQQPTPTQQTKPEPLQGNYNSFGPKDNLQGNETTPAINKEPLYIPPDLSREALMSDVTMRTFVAHIDEISNQLGKEIKKSTELAVEWQSHIKNVDDYIKSLSNIPWKKILTYSACLLTIGAFLYKMAAWRMIPNFVSNVISFIPSSVSTATPSANVIREVPKPNIENTINTIMQTPLTPITIVTCLGGMTVAMVIVKGLVWVLRKVPK